MSAPSAVPPVQGPSIAHSPAEAESAQHQQFSGLAWTGLILGIVGVVGSPVIFINNLTAIAAGVGAILSLIALFGGKKLIATIGLVLTIAAIVFTVMAQQAAVKEINKTFDEITNSLNSIQP